MIITLRFLYRDDGPWGKKKKKRKKELGGEGRGLEEKMNRHRSRTKLLLGQHTNVKKEKLVKGERKRGEPLQGEKITQSDRQ